MKRTYKFGWIILIALIPLLPLSGWNYSIDVSDVGFNLNQYRFCFTDMDSTYLPLSLKIRTAHTYIMAFITATAFR
jgi:hypothetical protein